MENSTKAIVNPNETATQIIRRYPFLRDYFEELGVDDCCLELDLSTIADHNNLELTALVAGLQGAIDTHDRKE